jgi:hypothetical protein
MLNLKNSGPNFILTTLLFFLLITPTNAQKTVTYTKKQYDMRLTYETITTPANNPMGLMGVHYELNNFFHPKAYLGIGGYGAITGDYGGFFTAGITPGIRISKFKPFILDIGLFIGGGGGASAFPGDGEMIRAHSYIGYTLKKSKFWLGITKQQISHTQLDPEIIFGYSSNISFFINSNSKKTLYTPIKLNTLTQYPFSLTPSATTYFPTSQNQGRNSTLIDNKITLLSLDINKQWHKNWLGIFSLSGANSAPADGFGAIFIGTGYNYTFSKFQLIPQLKIGMAGGGNIDTGGGLLIHPQLQATYKLNQSIALATTLGYIRAPSGTFETWQSSLGLKFNALLNKNATNNTVQNIAISKKSPYNVSWFIENKTTFPAKNIELKTNKAYENKIQFFGCGLSLPITNYINGILSTYWAYDGEVGAYAEGDFGLHIHKNLLPKLDLGIELLIGAAGGGGINVNNGTIHQETLTLSYKLINNTSFITKLGYQGAFSSDSFNGTVINFGFSQRINLL